MDIMGNVIPYIGGEEEKIENESQKILGEMEMNSITPAEMQISAQCTRVPVVDGHTESVSVRLSRRAGIDQVREALDSFRGMPQERKLPSAPAHPILTLDTPDRPQPARDIWLENGMATIVGRLRECPVLDYRMVLLGHNTVRGAAGASILNAEALVSEGYLLGDRLEKQPGGCCQEELVGMSA
jgi:aspartate-semialdehyde dehydrogenase